VSDRLTVAVLAMLMLAAGSEAFAQAIASGKNEVETDFTFSASTLTGVDSNRTTEYSWRLNYGRFLTDRFAIGPVFAIRSDEGNDSTPFNIGGLARIYVGDPDGHAIPFVEASSTRAFNQLFDDDYTDVQVSAGLVFPMGKSGGRFRIAPYYYRAFYDAQQSGYSYFHSFGVSWSVGLLF
jgi:hypothetical protein